MTLRGLPLAILDVETTGLTPADQVVEVAVAHLELGSDTPRLVFAERVRPSIPIPPEATKAHGITDADVAGCRSWAEVLPDVLAAVGDRVPVAYNAPFDFGFLPEVPWPWVDLFPVAKRLYRSGCTLTEVLARDGIVLDAHGAAGDVIGLGLVTTSLLRAAVPRSVVDLPALHAWLRRVALEEEASYVAWAARSGRLTAPDSPWHRLSGLEPPPFTPPPPAVRTCQCGAEVVLRVAKDGSVGRFTKSGLIHACTS